MSAELTPELLRLAATHLSEDFQCSSYENRRDPFMCNALKLAGGSAKSRQALQDLLVLHGAMETGQWAVLHATEDLPEEGLFGAERQGLRFMLFLFIAHWMESEAA